MMHTIVIGDLFTVVMVPVVVYSDDTSGNR